MKLHLLPIKTSPIIRNTFVFTTCLMIISCAVLLYLNGYSYFHYGGRYVTIEMKTPIEGYGQVYFDTGLNYQENQSYRFEIRPSSRFEAYRIPLPESTIKSIRFDPLDKKGAFEIKSITVETRDENVVWDGDKLAEQIVPLQQIVVESTKSVFTGFSTEEDPHFHVRGFTVPDNRHTITRLFITFVVFSAGIALTGVILLWMIVNDAFRSPAAVLSYECFLVGTVLYMFVIYAKGQWGHTVWFLRHILGS